MNLLLSSLLNTIVSTTKKASPRKAYSYLRFSTPEQMAGDSFRRQTELAQRYAKENGLVLDEALTYRDLGVSAYHGANAKSGKLSEFLEAVQKGVVPVGSFLLVESLDRISRQNPYDALGVLQSIVNGGVTLVTLMGTPKLYSAETVRTNPMALMEFLLIAVRAHEESTTKQRRAKEAWKSALSRVSRGESRGASAGPAWLRPSIDGKAWEPIQERVEVVRRIFKLAREGVGKDSIAKRLNAESVPTFDSKAKHWWGSYVYRILNNRAVVGEHIPHERVEDPTTGQRKRVAGKLMVGYYPQVIPKRLWTEVQAMQNTNPRRGRHASAPIANILGGLARCPGCGGAMTRVNKGSGPRSWPYFVCAAAKTGKRGEQGKPICVYKSVGYERVEDCLLTQIRSIVREAPAASEKARDLERKQANVSAALSATQTELENLLKLAQRSKGEAPESLLMRIREHDSAEVKLKAEQEKLKEQVKGFDKSLVSARLEELVRVAEANPLDRGAVNGALRRVLRGVVVDYRKSVLRFQWQHTDRETVLLYAWPDN